MDLSAQLLTLLASLGIPPLWALVGSIVIGWLLKKHLPNLKLPSLPKPAPEPVKPEPTPIPDSPILPNRPLLDALLRWLLRLQAEGKIEEAKLVGELVEKELHSK